MKHVCHLSSVHPWNDVRVFHKECRSLASADYRVTLIARGDEGSANVDGVDVLRVPPGPRWKRPMVWRQCARHVMALRPDLLHFHDPELIPTACALGHRLRVPVIYDCHEDNPAFIKIKYWLPRLVRLGASMAFDRYERGRAPAFAAVITADDAVARRFDGTARTVVVFNYPIVPAGSRASQPEDKACPRQIIYVGVLSTARGSLLMLEAMLHLLESVPDAHLRVVGGWDNEGDRRRAEEFLEAHRGLRDHVSFTGRVPHATVLSEIARSAVGWAPLQDVEKYNKNIPTKLFEYMLHGLPVVASDLIPIRPYITQARCGLLADPGDPLQHATALKSLLEAPQAARETGQRGRQAVHQEYNWNNEAQKLLALYARLLE